VSQGARWPATRASHRQAARSPEEVVAHANHESPDGTIGAIDHELVFHDADVLVFLPSLARALAATGATVPAERLLGHALGSPIELAREAALFEVPGVHASFVLRDFLASPPPSLTPALRAEIARTLADIFLAQGRYAEAEQLLHDAVACFGPGDPAASRARAELAWAYALQDRLPQALDAARTALELGARASDVEAAYARITHALILARGGDRSGAADASAALATLEAQRGRDDETVVNLRRRVTSLLIDAG
jgi:tetratricopeptide (TPR) repeat protein